MKCVFCECELLCLYMQELFLQGIQGGTMESFYKLISYFQTQSEPAYCGLASLSMVLNALAIDPGRKWKGNQPHHINLLSTVCIQSGNKEK